jgi:hypothetical protein
VKHPESIISAAFDQFIAQWDAARERDSKIADISGRIDVLATLYNLGPNRSSPKPSPRAGGSRLQPDGFNTPFHSFGEWAEFFSKSKDADDVLRVLDDQLRLETKTSPKQE